MAFSLVFSAPACAVVEENKRSIRAREHYPYLSMTWRSGDALLPSSA
ncbi:hypothetical protein FHS55_000538 [Angulomicrobium tetraedrale]|uniref:Uncharacterized protein n=1 Tax=Ancylobacter tetraedralis TaxID=217068 RepID=A0A839Z2R3_9HYPH|nr:hypothetical protein [Ancylobacter tetraedralis]MBB3769952.1 hypothetical protein [Ancylobacter tetraedralis]